MAMGQVEPEDTAAGFAFGIAAAASLGALSWNLFDLDMQETVLSMDPLNVTLAGGVSALILLFVIFTNSFDMDQLSGWYYYAVGAGILLTFGTLLTPVYDVVVAADWRIALTLLAESFALGAIAYGG
jgi:hypothetical protein